MKDSAITLFCAEILEWRSSGCMIKVRISGRRFRASVENGRRFCDLTEERWSWKARTVRSCNAKR